jgi:hypothetical protein
MSLEQWIRDFPPLSRFYLCCSLLLTAACSLEIITPYSLYFSWDMVLPVTISISSPLNYSLNYDSNIPTLGNRLHPSSEDDEYLSHSSQSFSKESSSSSLFNYESLLNGDLNSFFDWTSSFFYGNPESQSFLSTSSNSDHADHSSFDDQYLVDKMFSGSEIQDHDDIFNKFSPTFEPFTLFQRLWRTISHIFDIVIAGVISIVTSLIELCGLSSRISIKPSGRFQWWRCFTTFLFFGEDFSIDFMFHMYFM